MDELTPEQVQMLDVLQGQYDRLVALRGRTLNYYDDCPDGDPRKLGAEAELASLGTRIRAVERKIEEILDPTA
jgi:hypothetical protein